MKKLKEILTEIFLNFKEELEVENKLFCKLMDIAEDNNIDYNAN